jgi:hypothetical protein
VVVAWLMQTHPAERLEAIQRHLNREGSELGLLFTLLGFAGFGLLLIILHRLHVRSRSVDVDRPQALFRKLVQRLDLSVRQRGLLRRIAADLALENPSVLLLGRRVFEMRAGTWLAANPSVSPDDRRRLEDLADLLFPPTRH